MIVMLFGAPGTGKSTYAKYLSHKLNLPWISTGNVFREIAQTDPRIKGIIDAGHLVPDEDVNRVIFERLSQTGGNFILDGFPRTLSQAESFRQLLRGRNWKIDHIFHLSVPVELVVARMLRRGRADDTPETVKDRFNIFESQTRPVIDYFENLGVKTTEIDNTPPIAEVEKEFDRSLGD